MVALLVWVFTVTSQIKKPTLLPSVHFRYIYKKKKNASTFCKHFQVHSTEKQKHSSLIPLHQRHRFLNHITLKKAISIWKQYQSKECPNMWKLTMYEYTSIIRLASGWLEAWGSMLVWVQMCAPCCCCCWEPLFLSSVPSCCVLSWMPNGFGGNHCGNRTNRDDTEH